ncbi:hypothetical protein BDZ91DRAFT_795912 [Kalaharituber pfeilii]|nr:hypothetical protein BDZ91DRAFT_795912 [Kalaharituber pfeilii]
MAMHKATEGLNSTANAPPGGVACFLGQLLPSLHHHPVNLSSDGTTLSPTMAQSPFLQVYIFGDADEDEYDIFAIRCPVGKYIDGLKDIFKAKRKPTLDNIDLTDMKLRRSDSIGDSLRFEGQKKLKAVG